MNSVLSYIRREPAVIMLSINALLALCVAWGVDISAHNMGVILTISTGVLTLITALLAHPPVVPVVKGTAATLLVAFSGFGVLHLTTPRLAAVTAVISIALGLLFRTNLSPNTPVEPV